MVNLPPSNLSMPEWKNELFDFFNVHFQNCRNLTITWTQETMKHPVYFSSLNSDKSNGIIVTSCAPKEEINDGWNVMHLSVLKYGI
jgi:hypothetical protein